MIQMLIQVRSRDYIENLDEERQAAIAPLNLEFTDYTSFNTIEFENKKLIVAITQTMTDVQQLQDVIDADGLSFRWIILAATDGWVINYEGDLVPNHLIYYKKGVVAPYLIDTTEPYQVGMFQGTVANEGED